MLRSLKNNIIWIFLILAIVVSYNAEIDSLKAQLKEAKTVSLTSKEQMKELVNSLPGTGAALWQQGCEGAIEDYIKRVEASNFDLSLELFVYQMECERKSQDVEDRLVKIFKESFSTDAD